jgi:hypothetical protein
MGSDFVGVCFLRPGWDITGRAFPRKRDACIWQDQAGRLDQLGFKRMLDLCRNEIDDQEYHRILKKIEHSHTGYSKAEEINEERILGPKIPSLFTGYKVPDMEKAGRMVQYFAQWNKPFTTMLNKLMFYADFLHYRRTGYGISGLTYKAIQLGPVPQNYGGLYGEIVEQNYANLQLVDFGNYEGEQFYTDTPPDPKEIEELFTTTEWKAITDTAENFKKHKTKHIVEASHEEHAWQLNVDASNRIKYDYGFYLRSIE